MRILAVDDEELALETLVDAIAKAVPQAEIVSADNYKAVLLEAEKGPIDVAFLDIEMPGMNGIALAKRLKESSPMVNIVFVTAYTNYALEAHRSYASGYFLKPITASMVTEAISNLRHPIISNTEKLRIQCFGKFEVFYKGIPVAFKRSKAKEVLAYLIELKGASANTAEIASILWEDSTEIQKNHKYLWTLMGEIKRVLKECHAEDVLIQTHNSYAINCDRVDCDYYRFIQGDLSAINSYQGVYMSQYSWGEMTLAALNQLY